MNGLMMKEDEGNDDALLEVLMMLKEALMKSPDGLGMKDSSAEGLLAGETEEETEEGPEAKLSVGVVRNEEDPDPKKKLMMR